MKKKIAIIVYQHPEWLDSMGTGLMILGIIVIALLADSAPVLALFVAPPLLASGAYALGHASGIEQERSERAAKTAQIERELEIG